MPSPPTSNGVISGNSQTPETIINLQIAKLRKLQLCWRWLCVAALWMTLGIWSIWELRESIALLIEYFSFTGIVYGFLFHAWAGCGLITCLLFTISSIFHQIRYLVWEVSAKQKRQLTIKVEKIQAAGAKHPLWRWIQP